MLRVEERSHHRSIAIVIESLVMQRKTAQIINQNNPSQSGQQNRQADRGNQQGQDPNQKPGQQTQNLGQGGQKSDHGGQYRR